MEGLTVISLMTLFFQLLIGHAIGDFVLQPNPMSSGKNRHNRLQDQYGDGFPPWYYWLSAHALTHAGIVYIVTGSALCALLECISHWLIDFGKCEKNYSLHVDQCLHLLVKAALCILLVYFPS
ncbi:MAG: hypothetical protein RLZZ227_1917 [Pseudomonadota bacterium]